MAKELVSISQLSRVPFLLGMLPCIFLISKVFEGSRLCCVGKGDFFFYFKDEIERKVKLKESSPQIHM